MGATVSVVAGALSAVLFALFGYVLWVAVVVGVVWACAFGAAAVGGHRAFRTGANTDLPLVVLGFGIMLAIVVPKYAERHRLSEPERAADAGLP